MAINNFIFKSFSELQAMAERYKTNLRVTPSTTADPVYTVEDVSKEEFHNITTFLYNASVKDAKVIDGAESPLSLEFSGYLAKYMDLALTGRDVINLKRMVSRYNGLAFSQIYNNVYGYVFGLTGLDSSRADQNSLFFRMVSGIEAKLNFLVSKVQNSKETHTAEYWLTGTEGLSTKVYTARQFFEGPFQRTKIVEGIVTLAIISYVNKEDLANPALGGSFENSGSSIIRNPDSSIIEEDFFKNSEGLISNRVKDFSFSQENAFLAESETGGNLLESVEIRDDSGILVSSIPVRLLSLPAETLLEQYNFITVGIGGTISFDDLMEGLFGQMIEFVDNINNVALTDQDYIQNISYFRGDTGVSTTLNNIESDLRSAFRTMFYKDTIVENQRIYPVSSGNPQKLSATPLEIASSQSQSQLLFIDVRDVEFSEADIADAEALFGEELGNEVATEGTEGSEQQIIGYNRLTYTVLYKELNQALRQSILSDVQDYVFSRMLISIGVPEIFEADSNGISYNDAIEEIYRAHKEEYDLFRLSPELSRYRFFYGNGYNSRKFAESEIIGYYVGDASPESSFTNNYGRYEYQRREISSFIDIYRTTRDYYYRVLLNKSFIQDTAYPLYERLFIGWAAIERFLSSKISNLRDADYFNDEDIFNFLESYGLGVLNQYDFSLPNGRNYKTNIIKYFNQLIRLKGSRDVIPLLARVFDVDDSTLEVKKFLLIDAAKSEYPDSSELQLSLVLSGLKVVVKIGNSTQADIVTYDPNRVYFYNGLFKNASWATVSPATTYFFDEEKYKLYQRTGTSPNFELVEKTLTYSDTAKNAPAGEFVLNELTGLIRSSSAQITFTPFSIVRTQPVNPKERDDKGLDSGDIYYSSETGRFYEKIPGGWQVLKVSQEYPDVVRLNANLEIPQGSELSATLRLYDGNYFAEYEEGLPVSLVRYDFASNSVISVLFQSVEELPRQPGFVNSALYRVLIRSGLVKRSYAVEGQPIEYSPSAYVTNTLKSLELQSKMSEIFEETNAVTSQPTSITVRPKAEIAEPDLRFIEVPYSSDNGTREIKGEVSSGVAYEEFINRNVSQGIDPYWTLENVPTSTLETIGESTDPSINRYMSFAVETKYLSLTISENVYRNYAITRYLLSAIELLEDRFLVATSPEPSKSIVSRIVLDSGSALFGEASIYDFLQAVKVLFKANVKLYSLRGEDYAVRGFDSARTRFYGVNGSATIEDWNAVTDSIRRAIPEFDDIVGNFLVDVYKTTDLATSDWTAGATSYDKFNLYNKTLSPIDFGAARSYKRDAVDSNGIKVLNRVSSTIRNSIYSTHKLSPNFTQQSSGELALRTIENLNGIRIEDGQNLWSYFLSKYYDASYNDTDAGLLLQQLSQGSPTAEELYYKVIEDMITFPLQVFDGLLNESYTAENKFLNSNFVDLATTIFDKIYTQPAADKWEFVNAKFSETEPSGSAGEYWYRPSTGVLKKHSGTSPNPWTITVSASLISKGTYGTSNPTTGTNGTYFLNITDNVLYLRSGGNWVSQVLSTDFGDFFIDETAERVLTCLPGDPAFKTNTGFENQALQDYLQGALDIVNGITDVPTFSEELTNLVDTYTEKLFAVADSFTAIFASEEFMRVRFSLSEGEQQTISFVETAVKLFLSYTSQLYSSKYKREFRTESESAPISERVEHSITGFRTDYAFYDEKLQVEKEV
jgi:hypothetical protein